MREVVETSIRELRKSSCKILYLQKDVDILKKKKIKNCRSTRIVHTFIFICIYSENMLHPTRELVKQWELLTRSWCNWLSRGYKMHSGWVIVFNRIKATYQSFPLGRCVHSQEVPWKVVHLLTIGSCLSWLRDRRFFIIYSQMRYIVQWCLFRNFETE